MKTQTLTEKILEFPHCRKEIKLLFAEQFIPVEYLKGQVIISPNFTNPSLYFVVKGILRRYPMKIGKAKTSQLFFNGNFIVQNGQYLKKINAEYLDCLTPVTLLSISPKQIERFFRKEPEAVKLLLCILEEQKLKEIECADMTRIDPAMERYQFASAILGKIIHELPNSILSSYLRISEKQLSRILFELAHNK